MTAMKSIFAGLFLLIFITSCYDEELTAEELQAEMSRISTEIDELISMDCTNATCNATPIGVKACGGPTHYIIHSSKTPQNKLNALISAYNKANLEYNQVTGIFSDCSIVNPPEVVCVSGECIESE